MSMIMFVLVVLVPLVGVATESVKIEGEVNANYQIVDSSGQVFEVADTDEGNDMVENHTGEKVNVTGTIEKDGDVQIITVMSYETIE